MEYIEKTLTGIITHGTNSITFTDDFITNESIIDVYFSDDDITPTEQTQDGNRLIISIESQPQDVSIAVHITNDDTINYADELESLSDTVESLSDTVDSHATTLSDLELEFETLDIKVDGLNASNINYDEHSTLYSAMGDIDDLETTSKNLVGAINENFTSVSNGKSLIADAITDKGVPTSATDTFQTMANNIGEIETGVGGQSVEYADAHYINGHTLGFTAENTGYLYVVYNEVNSGNGNQTLKCGGSQIMSRTNWKANGNQRTDFLTSRVITGDVIQTNNTNYGSATRIVCCSSNKAPTENIINFDNCGCYFNASGGVGASTSQYTFVAKKSGVLHCNMAEQNVSNNGNVTINGVSASRTEIWQSGNIHGRYFTANVNQGDTVVVGCPPSNWYGGNSFLRALCIIV